jgi:hypothetical protein
LSGKQYEFHPEGEDEEESSVRLTVGALKKG